MEVTGQGRREEKGELGSAGRAPASAVSRKVCESSVHNECVEKASFSAYTGSMKSTRIAAYIIGLVASALTAYADNNRCEKLSANVDERDCYSKEDARVTAEADLIAAKLSAGFLQDAHDYGGVIAESLRRARIRHQAVPGHVETVSRAVLHRGS